MELAHGRQAPGLGARGKAGGGQALDPGAQRVGIGSMHRDAACGGKAREIVQVGGIRSQRVARGAAFRREHFQERLDVPRGHGAMPGGEAPLTAPC